jgi:Uma2 family endonuclease
MSGQPATYTVTDPEAALKYAIRHLTVDHVEIVEGTIDLVSRPWDHERAVSGIYGQLSGVARRAEWTLGRGDLDLPGSSNWYVPDLAVVPVELTADARALLPAQTLLVVEVTTDTTLESDRVTKRRRYAEYGTPLYLLVDRQERSCSLFSLPGELGYTRADGPHPFGAPLRLPEPFELELDTTDFG